jgi:hypothetical protein
VASDLVKDLPKECNFVLDKHTDTTHIGTNQTKRKKRKVFKTTVKHSLVTISEKEETTIVCIPIYNEDTLLQCLVSIYTLHNVMLKKSQTSTS